MEAERENAALQTWLASLNFEPETPQVRMDISAVCDGTVVMVKDGSR